MNRLAHCPDFCRARRIQRQQGRRFSQAVVRVLEAKGKADGYYDQDNPFVHVRCEVWSDGGATTTAPDHWQIDWYHGADIIRENFWEYIDEYCPYPDSVRAVIANLYLPEELSGLFALDPRKLEEEESYKRRTIF